MKEVVIVGALRTPIGCFQGTLARHSAVELGSMVVKALIDRTAWMLMLSTRSSSVRC
ncbi:Acetyl-CoA acetyl transferase [Salmonella enterica subsp. arizonae]|uniref:Acetyl-CoA acetyl transferase n=1 Tax=Salmonella enterica subsp. arizonae TaxID=59203 RepID=A0A379SQ17_SALER|nr:Acetyl-CoA acetyl transferase [Salmonella enterica subsp. arizonae]